MVAQMPLNYSLATAVQAAPCKKHCLLRDVTLIVRERNERDYYIQMREREEKAERVKFQEVIGSKDR